MHLRNLPKNNDKNKDRNPSINLNITQIGSCHFDSSSSYLGIFGGKNIQTLYLFEICVFSDDDNSGYSNLKVLSKSLN